jgi:DNA-binding SARP family transcriptional activator/ABC-type glycerol-3-phosphate transport system substrate-binding protein
LLAVEFRILGPLEVVEDGRGVPIASARQRALLALLVLHANEPMSADRIADELWGEAPPPSGAKAVAFHVSRLRRALELATGRGDGAGALETVPAGYVLRVGPDQIDSVVAARLCREGERLLPDDPAEAHDRLDLALGLWRGEPLSDLASEPFAQPEIARLGELRLRLLEDRIEADLRLGRSAELVGELRDLVAANPYRERLRGYLMLALYRCGRQAEALRTFQDGRTILVEELGIDPGPELQELERAILRQDAGLCSGVEATPGRNPFKGMRPFDEHDAPDFFGRETLIRRLVDRLDEVARGDGLLVLVGPSGSGKSSVVRAGLVPAIRRGALAGSQGWSVAIMVPGNRPFDELTAALRRVGVARVRPDHVRRDGGFAEALERLVPDGRLLLVVDQLEELFWRVANEAERRRFAGSLTQALASSGGRLVVVATLRADALDLALSMPELSEPVRTGLEIVGRLSREELTRAITRPAELAGVEVEDGLVARMIADVEDRPGTLPLLQYSLSELYDQGAGRRLTCDAYEALGGVMGSVGRRAEQIYRDLEPDAQPLAREVFLRLVAPHQGTAPTARRVSRAELESLDDGRGGLERVLVAFGRARLVSFDRDPVTGEPTVEPAHEALLSQWGRVAGWIEEAREGLWMRERLAEAAADWTDAGDDPGYLLTGSRLALFRDWAVGTTLRLSAAEQAYLRASEAAEQQRADVETARRHEELRLQARASRWLRASVALSAGAAILAVAFAAFALVQASADREQQAIAVSRELAAASVGNLSTDPELSLLLATEAAAATADRGYVTEEALDALHWALQGIGSAYPPADAPAAVRASPFGSRGIYLISPEELLRAGAAAAARPLTADECRTYLHRAECAPLVIEDPRGLDLYGRNGIRPMGELAVAGLDGTRVTLAADPPDGIDLELAVFEERSGITVELVPVSDRVSAREGEDHADLILTARSGWLLERARRGLAIDLSALDVAATARAGAAGPLVRRWSADLDDVPGLELYGAPLLASVGGLVLYRPDAFAAAGFEAPRSWGELEELTVEMLAGDVTPWCLGLEDGPLAAAIGVDWVEDLVLLGAGPDVFAGWADGDVAFDNAEIVAAARRLGAIAFRDGAVLGGRASALSTPASSAGLPLTGSHPRCWLSYGESSAIARWPELAGELDAFPFPPPDPVTNGLSRGRVYGISMVSDRPEVRAVLRHLLTTDAAAELMRSLGPRGLFPLVGVEPSMLPVGVARTAAERLATGLRRGTFQGDATDAMPTVVGAWTFPVAIERYLGAPGPLWDLEDALDGVDEAWPTDWP